MNETTANAVKSGLLLVISFLCLVSFLHLTDVYHQDFFTPGYMTLLYNVCRTVFMLFIFWMIYAVGYLTTYKFTSLATAQSLSIVDKIILYFGIGTGIVQIALLLLGLANLYYTSVAMILCSFVLAISAPHFNRFILETKLALQRQWHSRNRMLSICQSSLMLMALIWLLLVRGLYPAGGHDYYTHYFYYYLNVIRDHGLTPNDVWYHFFYSKGAGLFFLGILLTDPLAPSLMTYIYVTMASLAIISMISRIAPRSLWPQAAAILYIAYNLAALNGTDGGEFQKIHEITSSLTILMIWGVCMLACWQSVLTRTAIIMLSSVTIAATILTQATGIFFGVYFAVLGFIALVLHDKAKARIFFFLASVAVISVSLIFLLNYLIIGIPSDQSLTLMWKMANIERLHQLGLLPNILITAWVRENYSHVADPWGVATIHQLITFMRIDVLKFALASLIIPVLTLVFRQKKHINSPCTSELYYIFIALAVFGVMAILLGHSQAISFLRYSSFFFPLMVLMLVIIWSAILPSESSSSSARTLFAIFMPVFLFYGVIHSWNHWPKLMRPITVNSALFASGQYSIADAYAHEPTGYTFGGINPGVWQAVQHAPAHARIWSTNVASYCMAPDCQIESVISFKLSSRMNSILNGAPEVTKNILQQERLNYFIFSDDYPLRDLLIYSELFNPKNILSYLAVSWTDSKTYLLTWRNGPISSNDKLFLQAYTKHYEVDDDPSFKFSNTLPVLKQFIQSLEDTPHPWRPIAFPWQKTPSNQMT